MKINFKKDLIIIAIIISLTATSLNSIHFVSSASSTFNENFSNIFYLDEPNTNTTGWGTGTISLPQKVPTFIGSYNTPGYSENVVIDGNLAFIADTNRGLQIVNISSPSTPVFVGNYTPTLFRKLEDVKVAGDLAFVAYGLHGFHVVNVTNPSNPTEVDKYDPDDTLYWNEIFIDGNYAYAATNLGLYVMDISDPTNINLVGSLAEDDVPASGLPRSIFVEGDYAYIACGNVPLWVVDISDPTTPVQADTYDPADGYGEDICVAGNYVYIACGVYGLFVIDIKYPTSVSYEGSISINAWDVVIDGDYAYVAVKTGGLNVVDIRNPSAPTLLDSYNTPHEAVGIYQWGNNVYISDGNSGLQIIAISDDVAPYIAAEYDLYQYSYGLYVEGDYCFVADLTSGLHVFDINNPKNPIHVGLYNTTGKAMDICIEGNYAYLAYDELGLVVLNILEPTNPTYVDSVSTLDRAFRVEVEGNYAFVSMSSGGVDIIDISDPTNPTKAGNYKTPVGDPAAYNVFLTGDYMYVAYGNTRCEIVDISDPTNPTYITECGGITVKDVDVSGNYAYVLLSGGTLTIYNVIDPSNPILVETLELDPVNYPFNLVIDGDIAYIADQWAGVLIVDISDPYNPIQIDNFHYGALDIHLAGDYVFVSDYNGGLKVIEVRRNRGFGFQSPCRAQSLYIETVPVSTKIRSAELTCVDSIPLNSSIDYYLSADNGAHWELTPPGTHHYFNFKGRTLKWRAIMSIGTARTSPTMSSFSITYYTELNQPTLLNPLNDSSLTDTTPTFEWESVDGAGSYLIQISNSTSFSSLIINETIPSSSLTYTVLTPLPSDSYFWRVAAIDDEDDIGAFSEIRSFSIEIVIPEINASYNVLIATIVLCITFISSRKKNRRKLRI